MSAENPLERIKEAARLSRERESLATSGPWQVENERRVYGGAGFYDKIADISDENDATLHDLEFIAAARTELGQWREATEMLADTLARIPCDCPLEPPGHQGDSPFCPMAKADAALAAVAEKVKGGQG